MQPKRLTNCSLAFNVLLALALVAAAGFGATAPAKAAGPYTVNSTLDEPDATVGDGVCASTPSGVCTLRAAIMEANFNNIADTINLPAAAQPYQITRAGGDNTALNGDLDILTPMTIAGGGAANTIIDGGDLDRIFHIANPVNVTISGVTIRNGRGSATGGGILSNWQSTSLTLTDSVVTSNDVFVGEGGGIYSVGTLIMNNVVVSDNHVITGGGGGLFVPYAYGNTTISNSLIAGNTDAASAGGGGIRNGGAMTLNYTTVSGNTSAYAYSAGGIFNSYGTLTLNYSAVTGNQATSQNAWAGGIVNQFGTLNLNYSTVSGNQLTYQYTTGAGGIYNSNTQGGSATLTNTTVSGNRTRQYGGGVKNDVDSVMYLRNATIVYNRADSDDSENGSSAVLGSGLANVGTVYLRNTIIAKNVRGIPGNEDPDDCAGSVISEGYNLVGTGYGCLGLSPGVNGEQVGTNGNPLNPMLGALAYNGGATMTHALLAGSPAIDAGNLSGCNDGLNQNLANDQRGFARAVDGDGVNGARCDIGAFEKGPLFQLFVPVALH